MILSVFLRVFIVVKYHMSVMIFHMKEIAIATISLIRTPKERDMIVNNTQLMSSFGIPIIIVDGGSPDKDVSVLQHMKHVLLFQTKKGLTAQLRIMYKEAAWRAQHICYLQIDKQDYIENHVRVLMDEYFALPTKGMYVPERAKKSFATYPIFQQRVEEFLNFFIGDYIGMQHDYYYGPKIHPASLTQYIEQLRGDIGWGGEAFLYVIAKRLGLPFQFVELDVAAPQEVYSEEQAKQNRLYVVQNQIDAFLQAQRAAI